MRLYATLHTAGDEEIAECSDLALEPTSRAASGGLKVAVEFLSRKVYDPRAYLSEGHLDSLGICLYLATAKLFNAPGSLLVLDDILTSIDRDHRHRVRDLLLAEFQHFQLILTTHDETWFMQLQDGVRARGDAKDWRFLRLANWTVETGPETSEFEATWAFVHENLSDPEHRELGGSLRCLLEDFLKRVAEGLNLLVRYRRDGRYSTGDFIIAGVDKALRDALVKQDPSAEEDIKQAVVHVFGSEVINAMSHEGDRRLEVPLSEVRDFVAGLESLAQKAREAKILAAPL